MSHGIVYVSADDEYLNEAARSAQSVRRQLPNVDIAVITNADNPPNVFDNIIELENPDYSWRDKVENLHRSPFKKTIFLDTDTYLCDQEGITDLFSLLDSFELAACHGLGRRLDITMNKPNLPNIPVPDSFPWFNSGVIAYTDADGVQKLFERWRTLYNSHQQQISNVLDQSALRQAIYESDIRIATLPFEYNYHILHPQAVGSRVHILHAHIENFGEVAEIVNRNATEKRYFRAIQVGEKAYVWQPSNVQTYSRYFYHSIRKFGVSETLRRTLSWAAGKGF